MLFHYLFNFVFFFPAIDFRRFGVFRWRRGTTRRNTITPIFPSRLHPIQIWKKLEQALGIANFLILYGWSGDGGPSSGAPVVRL